MPSETFAYEGEHFTHWTRKSFSECGTYDHTEGWTTCNLCDAVIGDESWYPEDEELEVHKTGACIVLREQQRMAKAVGEVLSSIFPKYCKWCDSTPCACAF